jgi:uncharacterized protein
VRIIDAHIHIYDIYNGFDIKRPLKKIPFGLLTVLEWLRFIRPGGQQKKSGRMLGDWIFMESCRRMQVCQPDVYLDYFDQNGIAQAMIMPIAPAVSTEKVLSVCENNNRFFPFASVDFSRPDPASDLERYMAKGCRGLKIHPVLQSVHPHSEKMYRVLDAFKKYQLPVTIHVGPCRAGVVEIEAENFARPELMEKPVTDFKDIRFIFAHMGLQYYESVLRMATVFENIYLDTSFQPVAVLQAAESAVGSGRIVFGTDFPLLNPKAVIRVVKKAFRSTEALENIFYKNIERLAKLPS